ncbi:MBL fold metallo-hydrolase [Geminicoccaceae bacterium 1502E]|nr:MBL fold metallo-hydrolase [Geminicoccaceae bacterium 1502E]
MTTRRGLMAGAAMAGAGMLGGAGVAGAAAPSAVGGRGQAPGFYQMRLGETVVTLVHDGTARRPLDDGFVRNAPVEEVRDALRAARQPEDTVMIPFTTTVVERDGSLVLIDAGTGGHLAPTAGAWMSNFRAAGYAPENVDAVVVSHFHGDHIQGLRDKDGEAVFPNARVLVPEAEWAFWMDEGAMSRAPEGMKGAFAGVRRVFGPMTGEVERFSGEKEVAPGITSLPAHGHTPGHTAFMLEGGGERLLVWSDTTNKPELFVRNPGWHAVFDMDGEQAAETRKRMLEMAAGEELRVAGYHFPFPATGFIAKEPQGWRFVPGFWEQGWGPG